MITRYGAVVDLTGNVIWSGRHGLVAERLIPGTFWGIAKEKEEAISKARKYAEAYRENKHAKPEKPAR